MSCTHTLWTVSFVSTLIWNPCWFLNNFIPTDDHVCVHQLLLNHNWLRKIWLAQFELASRLRAGSRLDTWQRPSSRGARPCLSTVAFTSPVNGALEHMNHQTTFPSTVRWSQEPDLSVRSVIIRKLEVRGRRRNQKSEFQLGKLTLRQPWVHDSKYSK